MSNQDIRDEELITQIKALPKDFLEELKNEVKLNREKENRKKHRKNNKTTFTRR